MKKQNHMLHIENKYMVKVCKMHQFFEVTKFQLNAGKAYGVRVIMITCRLGILHQELFTRNMAADFAIRTMNSISSDSLLFFNT